MILAPEVPIAIAFFDGQNLFHAAREAFGYTYPNYDPKALAVAICKAKGWALGQVIFYTGVPESTDNAHWHDFWQKKLATMGRQGIQLFTRSLRYRNKVLSLPGGGQYTF